MIEETSCKLRECDRRTQVGRFYYTLSAIVRLGRHEFMETTLNKANVIMYNGKIKFLCFFLKYTYTKFEDYFDIKHNTITNSFITAVLRKQTWICSGRRFG